MRKKKYKLIIISGLCLALLSACGNTGEPDNGADDGKVVAEIIDINESSLEADSDMAETEADLAASNVEESAASDSDMAEELAENDSLSIIMVGDMLLHDRIEAVSKDEDGTYSYGAIFEHTKDLIEEADIAIANEEVIIGGSELGISGYPAFNAPYEMADDLVETGFDVICHATNHALDKGTKGISNCLSNWNEKYPDIAVLGIYDSAIADRNIYICEKKGMKIAILNYTYGTNGISLPDNTTCQIDYLSEEKVKNDLELAEAEADFTIVCPHWGTEYSLETDAYQKKWADIFVENGADLIIGTHPHVIERVDWISHDESDKAALCYYSLGNFVNWTSGTGAGVSNRMLGAMASIDLKRDEQGQVVIDDYKAIPLVSHVTSKEDGVTVYPLSEYTEELAAENEIVSQAADFSYEYCRELADKVLGDVSK